MLIPLTCQSVLGLKERTEASFHIGQTALILFRSLLLQIIGCNLQLLETEEIKKQNDRGFILSLQHAIIFINFIICLVNRFIV